MLKKILRTAVQFDIPGVDKAATAVLSRQLMKIQLEEMDKIISIIELCDDTVENFVIGDSSNDDQS